MYVFLSGCFQDFLSFGFGQFDSDILLCIYLAWSWLNFSKLSHCISLHLICFKSLFLEILVCPIIIVFSIWNSNSTLARPVVLIFFFWSQYFFTLFKNLRTPKNICLFGIYLLILTVLESKTEKFF